MTCSLACGFDLLHACCPPLLHTQISTEGGGYQAKMKCIPALTALTCEALSRRL